MARAFSTQIGSLCTVTLQMSALKATVISAAASEHSLADVHKIGKGRLS